MTLVGVRATDSSTGLVAILVEDGGPAMVAVPVTARDGLVLASGDEVAAPTWIDLLTRTCRVLDAAPADVVVDADADARLTARIRLVRPARPSAAADASAHRAPETVVACSTGEALVLSQRSRLGLVATERLLDAHRLDLASEGSEAHVAAWRQELAALDDGARID